MAKKFSEDLCAKIHELYLIHASIKHVAKILKISRHAVRNAISPGARRKKGRKPRITDEELPLLADILDQGHDLFLSEIQERFFAVTAKWISVSIFQRAITSRIYYSRKKIQPVSAEQFSEINQQKRLDYLAAFANLELEDTYFVDETGVCELLFYR